MPPCQVKPAESVSQICKSASTRSLRSSSLFHLVIALDLDKLHLPHSSALGRQTSEQSERRHDSCAPPRPPWHSALHPVFGLWGIGGVSLDRCLEFSLPFFAAAAGPRSQQNLTLARFTRQRSRRPRLPPVTCAPSSRPLHRRPTAGGSQPREGLALPISLRDCISSLREADRAPRAFICPTSLVSARHCNIFRLPLAIARHLLRTLTRRDVALAHFYRPSLLVNRSTSPGRQAALWLPKAANARVTLLQIPWVCLN